MTNSAITPDFSFKKRVLPHVLAVLFFFVISLIYFYPLTEGKRLMQSDTSKYRAMSQELREYYEKEGGSSEWTGSMFSGMPSYQIGVWGKSPSFLEYLEKPFKFVDYQSVGAVFCGLIAFYILLLVMGVNIWLAIMGAIAFAFSSYNIIILEAGHVTKAWVIAYMPAALAGMFLLFRQKYLAGGLLFTVAIALGIKNNHLQITYYLALFCGIVYIGFLIACIMAKNYKRLLVVSGILLAAVGVTALTSVSNIYSNYEMSKESTRGKSELTVQADGKATDSEGLDIEYAFSWSYGKAETFTLLVPNLYGGVSKPFTDESSETYKTLVSMVQTGKLDGNNANYLLRNCSEYWGDQPFTQGPTYFGAIICFLFILSLFVLNNRNPIKWCMVVAVLFFFMLSWGRHLPGFNTFMFHYLPMYNKFRTVSMALVIPGLIFPFLAALSLKGFFDGSKSVAYLKKALLWAFGITGGICFLFWLFPSAFFDFGYNQLVEAKFPDWLISPLVNDRKALLQADAFRSLVFVVLAFGVLFLSLRGKNKGKWPMVASIIIGVLVLVDLWNIDKRFLNKDNFVSQTANNQVFAQSAADKAILKDTDPSYRVFNLSGPFTDAYTSYWHKSIGGYHAAKLGRYQELIDHRLMAEHQSIVAGLSKPAQTFDSVAQVFKYTPTLDMLNARYIVYSPDQPPLRNPYALGNAWFVNNVQWVNNADEEIAALNSLNPAETAVVDKRFSGDLDGFTFAPDSAAHIKLLSYKPNKLVYESQANSKQLAVFSEVYYQNGWVATIDGQPAPHFRADWILRSMIIPEGKHTIEFEFIPTAYRTAITVTSVSSFLLVLAALSAIVYSCIIYIKPRKKENEE